MNIAKKSYQILFLCALTLAATPVWGGPAPTQAGDSADADTIEATATKEAALEEDSPTDKPVLAPRKPRNLAKAALSGAVLGVVVIPILGLTIQVNLAWKNTYGREGSELKWMMIRGKRLLGTIAVYQNHLVYLWSIYPLAVCAGYAVLATLGAGTASLAWLIGLI